MPNGEAHITALIIYYNMQTDSPDIEVEQSNYFAHVGHEAQLNFIVHAQVI